VAHLTSLVKWKNYLLEEVSWEPVANLGNAKESIMDFHRNHPNAPQKVHTMPIMRKYENYTQQVTPKKLFGWEDGKFERDYLERLEQAWGKWKG
jgi:hypothetical protein